MKMKKARGVQSHLYVAFKNEHEAMRWHWLFGFLMRKPLVCYGGYLNAYKVW